MATFPAYNADYTTSQAVGYSAKINDLKAKVIGRHEANMADFATLKTYVGAFLGQRVWVTASKVPAIWDGTEWVADGFVSSIQKYGTVGAGIPTTGQQLIDTSVVVPIKSRVRVFGSIAIRFGTLTAVGIVRLRRDTTEIAVVRYDWHGAPDTIAVFPIECEALTAAGTYSYNLEVKADAGTGGAATGYDQSLTVTVG